MRRYCRFCLQSFEDTVDGEVLLLHQVYDCTECDNPKAMEYMSMPEALSGLVDGNYKLVRPVKWGEAPDKSYGAIIHAPGRGTFLRVWPYSIKGSHTIGTPFILDDIDIVIGYWEAVNVEEFYEPTN